MGSTRQSGNPQLGKHALAVSSKAQRVKGLVDFDDVRLCVAERLMDTNFAGRIGYSARRPFPRDRSSMRRRLQSIRPCSGPLATPIRLAV